MKKSLCVAVTMIFFSVQLLGNDGPVYSIWYPNGAHDEQQKAEIPVLNAIATGAGLAAFWYFSGMLVKPLQRALKALENIEANKEVFNSSIDNALSTVTNDTDKQILLELFARYSKLQLNDPVKLEEIRETIKAILAKKPMKPAFKYDTMGKHKTWKPYSLKPYSLMRQPTNEFYNSKRENVRIRQQD
jgi:hypothetical protein